jgi:hypothetical protein
MLSLAEKRTKNSFQEPAVKVIKLLCLVTYHLVLCTSLFWSQAYLGQMRLLGANEFF